MRRNVLVTGAGSGIGLATALHLAEIGFEVTGLVPSAGEEQTLKGRAGASGLRIPVLRVDLSEPGSRRDVAGNLDLWALVNNAGFMNAGQIRDVPVEAARRQLETMVLAPVDLIHQALPAMIARGHGRIVNVTSSAVHASTPLTGWYVAAKAALRELNDSLRLELRACGVDVIDIEPGGYRTRIWPRAARELDVRARNSARPQLYHRVLRHLGSARSMMADPAAVARVIGEVLTEGRPPRHRRVGPGALSLRAADTLLPDAIWDSLVDAGTRMGSQ